MAKEFKYFYVVEIKQASKEFRLFYEWNIIHKLCSAPHLYKIGVTNDIKKRIDYYKKSGVIVEIIALWLSKGNNAKYVEDLFFIEMQTPFDSDDIRWGLKSEYFISKKNYQETIVNTTCTCSDYTRKFGRGY